MAENIGVTLSANDLHVITTQFLSAAQAIHVAMCRFPAEHAAQSALNEAMHSALIGAEQCRQAHINLKRQPLKMAEPEASHA